MRNLFDQEQWARRGENDARLADLTTRLVTAEAKLALINSGAWTAYTPTLTAVTTDPTLGTGSVAVGRYQRTGLKITGWAYILFGTAGVAAGSGTYRISLPAAHPPYTTTNSIVVGNGWVLDAGTAIVNVTPYIGSGFGTYVQLVTYPGGGSVSHNNPHAWAINDYIIVSFSYESIS